MLKNILFIAVTLTLLIVSWYFLWYKPSKKAALTGPCKTSSGIAGVYKNGVCTPGLPSFESVTL